MMLKHRFQIPLVVFATCVVVSMLSLARAQAAPVAPPPRPSPGVQIVVQPGEIPDCVVVDKKNRKGKVRKFKSHNDCQKHHVRRKGKLAKN